MAEDLIVLVNENDEQIGSIGKLEAHQKGLLHRAFSIIVWNDQHEILIHQRAIGKYHSEGLWTNTCCSHPKVGETILEAAHRRLQEEMGFDCELQQKFHFIYLVELENQLIENELDHVLIGTFNQNPSPNPEEIKDYRWISLEKLKNEIAEKPAQFTFWFKEIIRNYEDKIRP
jgi:isopentenyl-diphosphate delta-isomerase